MARESLEPRQERSRESLRKLQKATAQVLGLHGVEGTTIPRIARHAGLTPGAIYRRFHDKDALLEATILGILERQRERLRAGMTPEMVRQIPLPVFADQIIDSMIVSYRANAALLHAIYQFCQARVNQPFWKKAARLEIESFEHLVDLFMTHRKEVRSANPRSAIATGLFMVGSTLFKLLIEQGDPKIWKDLLPKDDQALRRELVHAFLAYLGVEAKEK